jgi:hypothetical protein
MIAGSCRIRFHNLYFFFNDPSQKIITGVDVALEKSNYLSGFKKGKRLGAII